MKQISERISEIAHCYKLGLKALGSNARFVVVRETRNLTGSIDLDGCSTIPNTKQFPKRWDYLIGYKSHVLALEIHNISGTNDAKDIIEKAEWLRNWISATNNPLSIHAPLFVVSPGGSVDSRANKVLAQKGLFSCGKWFDIDAELK